MRRPQVADFKEKRHTPRHDFPHLRKRLPASDNTAMCPPSSIWQWQMSEEALEHICRSSTDSFLI